MSQMQQMLMSIKWCQQNVKGKGDVHIFQPKMIFCYNMSWVTSI